MFTERKISLVCNAKVSCHWSKMTSGLFHKTGAHLADAWCSGFACSSTWQKVYLSNHHITCQCLPGVRRINSWKPFLSWALLSRCLQLLLCGSASLFAYFSIMHRPTQISNYLWKWMYSQVRKHFFAILFHWIQHIIKVSPESVGERTEVGFD